MSSYLQRLVDRGAGLAALPAGGGPGGAATGPRSPASGARPPARAGDALPAFVSSSPTVLFDQRLADPDLAGDFGLPGSSPEAEIPDDLLTIAANTAPAAWLHTPAPAAAPPGPGLTATPGQAPAPASPEARAGTAWPDATGPLAAPPVVSDRAPDAAVQPAAARPPGPSASRMPVPATPAAPLRAASPATQTAPLTATLPALATPTPAWPHPVGLPAATAIATASPVLEPQHHAPPSHLPLAVPQATPLHQSTLALPLPEVQPPRHAPAPLDPPPQRQPDARELERLVRAAVHAELARRPAPPPAPAAQASPGARERADPPAGRPATAHEASVIGPLAPSGAPLTVFGLRRR